MSISLTRGSSRNLCHFRRRKPNTGLSSSWSKRGDSGSCKRRTCAVDLGCDLVDQPYLRVNPLVIHLKPPACRLTIPVTAQSKRRPSVGRVAGRACKASLRFSATTIGYGRARPEFASRTWAIYGHRRRFLSSNNHPDQAPIMDFVNLREAGLSRGALASLS